MVEYNKIGTIFERDMNGSKKLIEGEFTDPTVDYLANNIWDWTEKVDGTNVRIHWDGHKVEFGGRTDNAQMPVHLANRLAELFGGEDNAQIFEQIFGEKDVILFGEGYGYKIQNGGDYTDGKSVDVILFDMLMSNNYQPRGFLENVASAFGVKVVPIVGSGTLKQAVEFVKSHPKTTLGNKTKDMEGLVCRPGIELRDRCGKRVIVKIKYKDFDLQG